MKRVFIGFMICFLFWNCDKKENKTTEQNLTYIISKENKKILRELKIKEIPPPPPGFYGYNQIIIDKKNNFYFYQKKYIAWHCIHSPTDTIPDFINIEPNDIIKIPNYSVIDFIKQNVSNKDETNRILVIGSQNDTIINREFREILHFLNNQSISKIKIFTVRRSTQEEDTVLKYKKNNEYYNSEDIKWDNERITFPLIKPILNHK